MSAAYLIEEVLANGGSVEGLPARPDTAPVVEAALVMHEGEMRPALLLEDGRAVVMSFEQTRELTKAFGEWGRMFLRAPSTGRTTIRTHR